MYTWSYYFFYVYFLGYIIPKGWRIYVYTRELNYDPRLYPDPYTFNPWRWMVSIVELHLPNNRYA